MATRNAQYPTHAQQDATLQVTANFNVAGAVAVTNGIKIGPAPFFPTNGRVTVQVSTTVATGANNKNVTINLQGADVDLTANYSNIATAAAIVIPELNAAYAATTVNFSMPQVATNVAYLRARAATEALGGAANDGTMTLKILL